MQYILHALFSENPICHKCIAMPIKSLSFHACISQYIWWQIIIEFHFFYVKVMCNGISGRYNQCSNCLDRYCVQCFCESQKKKIHLTSFLLMNFPPWYRVWNVYFAIWTKNREKEYSKIWWVELVDGLYPKPNLSNEVNSIRLKSNLCLRYRIEDLTTPHYWSLLLWDWK